MKKNCKRIMAAFVAALLLVTLPGVNVLADELQDDISVNEIYEEAADPDDMSAASQQDSQNFPEDVYNSTLPADDPFQIPTQGIEDSQPDNIDETILFDEVEDISLTEDDIEDSLVGALESTGNSTLDNFINDSRFTNGASWAYNKTPMLASFSSLGCCAYCADYVKYCYGINNPRQGTSFTNVNEIRQGDVLTVGNQSDGTGHWFVCLKRNGNSLYVAEGNYSNRVRIGWNYTISGNKFAQDSRSFTAGYHFLAASNPTVSFTPWSNANYTYMRDTDASIGMEINVSNGTCTSEGMYLYDSNGSYLARGSNPTHTNARVYFKINEEMGYTLQPATLYKYKFYAIVNGQTYWSDEHSFITNGRTMTSGYDRLLPDGDYQIVSAANTAYYLDIEGTAVPAGGGTNVSLCGPDSGHLPAFEIWNITYSDGFYTIRQKDTDMCLDLANADVAAYANVQMCQSNGSNAQKWAISRLDDKRGYRLEVKCSGMSLDIAGGSISTGTNVRQHPDNNTDAQRWLFIPYDPEKTIADGRYILVSALNPNLVLDISGDTANVPDETNVQVWNDSVSSRYNSIDVKYLDYGYYRLTHSASGKSLDVHNASSVSGTNVQLFTAGEQNNQKWAITKNGSGYLIWSRCSGLVLDVLNAGTSDGTNVVTANYNGSNAQTWKFVQAEYKVSYNANGGSGAPAAQTKYYRSALTLSSTKPTRSGYTFKGWATSKTATSAGYQAGGSYTQDKSITLYAVWAAQKKQISDCTVTLSTTSYTYNGKAKKPTATVKDGTTTLTADTDYTVSYANNTNAGTATVTITGKGNYTGTKSVTFTIKKAAAKLTFANASVSKTTKDAAFTNTLTKTTDGAVTFKSSNTSVATVVSTSGKVTIKGAGETTITATASAGTNYKAGSASYTLTVKAPAPAGFSDVQDPTHPFYKAIYWAADAGITKGYPDGTFGIDRSCTRGEAVMFLWRMAGQPAPVESLSSPFSDVPKTHTFYKAILWASQRGITKGYSDGTFGINRTCTRGHIMTFIWRFKGEPAPKAVAKSPFSDVPKTHAYYKAILWGAQTGVTNGFSDGTFGIDKNCTRGQIVTFLYRIK